MWELILRQLLAQAGRSIAGGFFHNELNGPEVYADRIKRDFHLNDYADAWALYSSDPKYWEKYYGAPPRPAWNDELVRDSAAAAGVPSRNNVFEYGFPAPGASQPRTDATPRTNRSTAQLAPSAGPIPGTGLAPSAGAVPSGPKWPPPSQPSGFPAWPPSNLSYPAPTPSRSSASDTIAGGLPGLIASVTGNDPSDPARFQPPAGGLLGLIQDYMRNNPVEGGSR